MTTIEIGTDYIHVFGHSGYAEEGKDIVCAAISVLTESLDRYLKTTENDVSSVEDIGDYTIFFNELNDIGGALISEYIKMADEICKQYPDNVRRTNGKTREIK